MSQAAEARMRWCSKCRSSYRADFARCPIDGAVIEELDGDPLLGTTIGQHYVIDSFIGEGSMARVYRAHHALLAHKQFAVKVMIGDRAATLEMRLRFAQEADAASQLDHPNVVSVVDFGKTDGGLMFIAMELIDGRSLATLIAEEAPLPAPRALALARQIALGLGHAHERGLVHRDLKPENIIISSSPEQVRVVDFGLAIPVDDERSTRLTSVGLAVGTPIYAAPEQTHNEPVDHRADLFALGVTLYEMLAGVTPFAGGLAELIQQNASDVVTPIAARSGVDVPPEVEALVRRLMRRDREERPASATEVIAAIDLASQPASAAVSLPAVPLMPRKTRMRWILAMGALSIAAIAGTVAVMKGGETAEPVAVAASSRPIASMGTPVGSAATNVAGEPAPKANSAPGPTKVGDDPPPSQVVGAATAKVASNPPRSKTIGAPAKALSRAIRPATANIAGEPAPSNVDRDPAPSEIGPPEPSKPDRAPEPAKVAGDPAPAPAKGEGAPGPTSVVAKPAAAALWTTATATVAGMHVRGALSDADVRRAVDRGLAAMRVCYQRSASAAGTSPAATVRVTFAFDDSRQAQGVKAIAPGWPALAGCVATAAEGLRVQVAPDVGAVDVVVDIAFTPVGP